MKKYLFIIFFSFSLINTIKAGNCISCCLKRSSSFTDTIITQLQNINLTQYQGQPVDSLLAHLPSGVIDMRIGSWRSIKLAEVLYVSYPNNVFVAIHVRDFQHMNPHWVNTSTPMQNWDINLFKQEFITFSIAFNNTLCINGCGNLHK